MNGFDTLQARGFFYQMTDETVLRERLNKPPVTFYIGFDPTADSLHVGHLLPVMAARFLQQCGHRPIILVGGGTAMVGDPSGKSEARQLLDKETIGRNAEALKQQLSRYISFADGGAQLVDNAEWLTGLNYIDFLRDVGRHFSVNRMLTAESVKQRLETGLSFLEFNYMLLQAYDFSVLGARYDCEFQLGGQDQWGNIVAGVDLTRRLHSKQVFGATFPLLTDSNDQKFGKSMGNSVWLDDAKTSVFEYYQFWRNVEDTEVGRLLGFFTQLPMAEVERLAAMSPPQINRAKEILAYEATALAHGREAAAQAYTAAGRQFGFADLEGQIATTSDLAEITVEGADDNLPTATISVAELADGLWVARLFVLADLARSNGEARRLIEGGGAYINDEKVTDAKLELTAASFSDGEILLRAGKKKYCRVTLA